MKEDIIKEVIKNFREKCRLGEPIGRWEKEMEFTVKLTLALQKKELLEKMEKYEKFVRKELDNADEKDLTMIAYDMHSRLVAIKHIIKKLLT